MNNHIKSLAEEYNPAAVEACEKALRSVLYAIGERWRQRIVLVGGLVPLYLYDESTIPDEIDPHIGSTDLDIGVGVLVDDEDSEAYTAIEREITKLRFEPQDRKWRWGRDVDGVTVLLEFLCPADGDSPTGRRSEQPVGGSGNLYALRIRGIELVPNDTIEVPLDGPLLDDRGSFTTTARVANLLPFLMLKALAMLDRDHPKDKYDVVWTLTAHDGGPEGAARLAAASPIAHCEAVTDAMDALRDLFAHRKRVGPGEYANFEMSRRGDRPTEELRQRLRRDAHGAVDAFLQTFDELVGAD